MKRIATAEAGLAHVAGRWDEVHRLLQEVQESEAALAAQKQRIEDARQAIATAEAQQKNLSKEAEYSEAALSEQTSNGMMPHIQLDEEAAAASEIEVAIAAEQVQLRTQTDRLAALQGQVDSSGKVTDEVHEKLRNVQAAIQLAKARTQRFADSPPEDWTTVLLDLEEEAAVLRRGQEKAEKEAVETSQRAKESSEAAAQLRSKVKGASEMLARQADNAELQKETVNKLREEKGAMERQAEDVAVGLHDLEKGQAVLQAEAEHLQKQLDGNWTSSIQSWAAELINIRAHAQVQAAQDELMYLKQRAGDLALEHVKQLEAAKESLRKELVQKRGLTNKATPSIVPLSFPEALQVSSAGSGVRALSKERVGRRALLIGCNYASRPDALQGAVNDAWNLFSTLRVSLGFPEPNVKLLVDTEKGERAPTKANILRALDTVVAGCPENVLILLTFSGYGAHSDGDGSIVILPCDFETAGVITLSEIMSAFVKLPASAHVVLLR